ncbi:serine hydrolase [Flavivirga aquatica]|uniref:Serine hydrolase n=1 Tax=Flavivirga aquatica TaxID=1849968 RepID=A0A1E5SII7_9FLAO|nr:serine hydrolase [Flavivirga aquatica]OEJ98932.1 serine hydrolase [Flavivirga aquatica]
MTPITSFKALLFITISLLSINQIDAQNLEENIDALIRSTYKTNEPGASILIAKNGKTIYKKAFGLANLELNVPMTSDHVFEIGSITKQFTAVSILMLEEQGKLNLTDNITKFIPDYPTQGKTITIHHLLNHTSGIKSYTSMLQFKALARKDMMPTQIIDVFKNEPMDFDPGEKFLYNNSGYILLGYIIEVVSKQTYEEFIETHIFKKLGMASSFYGNKTELINNRASGYSKPGKTYVNADYLSLTLPYAAGAIMSTVDDLLIWQNAIVKNKLIKKASLEKAINGSQLNNGKQIPYGYGWVKNTINGSLSYQHGGGIFGFTTMGVYLPEEDVFVSGLTNCNCKNINTLVTKIAAIAINKPYPTKKDVIKLSNEEKKKWVGSYELDNGLFVYITLKNGQLYRHKDGDKEKKIFPISSEKFILNGGLVSYSFFKKDGKKHVKFKGRSNELLGVEVDKPAPKAKKEITLPSNILKQYVGKYELHPSFIIEITLNNNKLFGQATGQPKFEMFAENESTFFLKVVPAIINFNKKDDGSIKSLILHQNGKDIEGKKFE